MGVGLLNRNMKNIFCLFLFSGFSFIINAQQTSKIIAPGAQLQLIDSGFQFTEGPAVSPDGSVFFTDQPNDRIYKWTEGKGVAVYLEGTGRSNGLYFDNDGKLLACADEKNQIWKFDDNKDHVVIVNGFEGKRLNGPNDLWVDPKGGIYFTDPFYKRPYWSRTEKEIEKENVYYISPDQSKVLTVAEGLVRPNGIIGTLNGKKLFVADIGDKKTYSFDIGRNGTLSNKTIFANMGSDGMTIDNKGNIYITGKGVTVFDKKGNKIEEIEVDEPWTANVCFGGRDQSTLFITASKSVYTLNMKVHGIR